MTAAVWEPDYYQGVPPLDIEAPEDPWEMRANVQESAQETRPAMDAAPPAPSWKPVDLDRFLDGKYEPATPTVGQRNDGRGVLYPGRAHSLVGESEAGKSWLAQLFCVQELARGNGVLYLDFEDEAGAVTDRLITLGVDPRRVRSHCAYIAPEEPLTSPGAAETFHQALRDLKPSLVVLDGVTEALSLHGFSTNDNDDVAKFGRLLTRPVTDSGAAVLSLDHVTKDRENRGRYAIGGVHKLNGLSGAALVLENVDRFGAGMTGKSRLLIAKDRPGQLRRHALPGTGDRYWFGDFTVNTDSPDPAELHAPVQRSTEPWRPTGYMTKVAAALTAAPDPLSVRGVQDRVDGRAEHVRKALAALVDEGYVQTAAGPRGATLHTLIKPFEETEQ